MTPTLAEETTKVMKEGEVAAPEPEEMTKVSNNAEGATPQLINDESNSSDLKGIDAEIQMMTKNADAILESILGEKPDHIPGTGHPEEEEEEDDDDDMMADEIQHLDKASEEIRRTLREEELKKGSKKKKGANASATNEDLSENPEGGRSTVIKYDPAVAELRALMAAAPPLNATTVSRDRVIKEKKRLNMTLLFAFVIIWTIAMVLLKHARTYLLSGEGMMSREL